MSLILEALRKSEAERRRAHAPDLFAEPQLALPRTRPAWPHWRWLVLGVVALIISVLLLRAMWLPAAPAAAARVAPLQPAPAARDVVASTQVQSRTPVRAQAATTMAAPPQPAPSAATVSMPSLAGRAAAVVVAPPPPPLPPPRTTPEPVAATPVAVAVPAQAVTADAGSLRLSDLAPEERQQLPPLKLSMHMWNDVPAQRFVILDGQRLAEGDRIGEAVVEQITGDGAILAWNGRRLRVGMR